MIRGLHHAAISTRNLGRLQDFYCELFGMQEAARGGWPRGSAEADALVGLHDTEAEFVYLSGGNAFLELFEFTLVPPPRPRGTDWRICDEGITHICFEVEDLETEHERLSSLGMRFQSPPLRVSGYGIVVYGFDPDGNVIELIQVDRSNDDDGWPSLVVAQDEVGKVL